MLAAVYNAIGRARNQPPGPAGYDRPTGPITRVSRRRIDRSARARSANGERQSRLDVVDGLLLDEPDLVRTGLRGRDERPWIPERRVVPVSVRREDARPPHLDDVDPVTELLPACPRDRELLARRDMRRRLQRDRVRWRPGGRAVGPGVLGAVGVRAGVATAQPAVNTAITAQRTTRCKRDCPGMFRPSWRLRRVDDGREGGPVCLGTGSRLGPVRLGQPRCRSAGPRTPPAGR